MTWLFALVVVAVLGATAVVAAGRGGSMSEVHDDRPDAVVPADRPLTATDLRVVRFGTALRGYRMAEVDALLERLAAELESRGQSSGGRRRSDPAEPPATP
jgi:DivIVA domain-containing protein